MRIMKKLFHQKLRLNFISSGTKPQLYFITKYYIIEFNKNIATTANTNDLV